MTSDQMPPTTAETPQLSTLGATSSNSSTTRVGHTVSDSDQPGLSTHIQLQEHCLSTDDWENDPENARNWSAKKKWINVAVVSLYTFGPPLSSSMMAPGLPDIARKYGVTDPTILALTLVIFLLSFAIAPLFLAPLSEMYGRTWIYHIGSIFTTGFSLGCAFSPNVGSLVAFRFLSGASGSVAMALGGGSISDLFSERDRASAMALYSLGPLIGPAVGPIAGGFIAETVGVKWVFIVVALLCGASTLIGIPLLSETYAPVIRARRRCMEDREDAEKLAARKLPKHVEPIGQLLWLNLSRPVVMLTTNLICFMLSLYMAFMYGISFLMFATFASLFHETYGFGTGTGGLVYLGIAIGFIAASIFGAKSADQIYHHLAQKNGGKGTPEMRIPALIVGSFFVPIGVLWYGWSADQKVHWIMPIIGSGIFGFGMMTSFLPIQLYLVDSYKYAASSIAAAALFRSLFGFAFPLFADRMFKALGFGGGNSLLAGLAVVLGIPFPVWLYYNGATMRQRSHLTSSKGF